MGKRLAEEDPENLGLLQRLGDAVDQAWWVAVAGQRNAGFSDRDIAEALGVTRPAVTQRWPRAAKDRLAIGDAEAGR